MVLKLADLPDVVYRCILECLVGRADAPESSLLCLLHKRSLVLLKKHWKKVVKDAIMLDGFQNTDSDEEMNARTKFVLLVRKRVYLIGGEKHSRQMYCHSAVPLDQELFTADYEMFIENKAHLTHRGHGANVLSPRGSMSHKYSNNFCASSYLGLIIVYSQEGICEAYDVLTNAWRILPFAPKNHSSSLVSLQRDKKPLLLLLGGFASKSKSKSISNLYCWHLVSCRVFIGKP